MRSRLKKYGIPKLLLDVAKKPGFTGEPIQMDHVEIHLMPSDLAKLDKLRGEMTREDYIRLLMREAEVLFAVIKPVEPPLLN